MQKMIKRPITSSSETVLNFRNLFSKLKKFDPAFHADLATRTPTQSQIRPKSMYAARMRTLYS